LPGQGHPIALRYFPASRVTEKIKIEGLTSGASEGLITLTDPIKYSRLEVTLGVSRTSPLGLSSFRLNLNLKMLQI
jgi:hypothetical protein